MCTFLQSKKMVMIKLQCKDVIKVAYNKYLY